METLNQEIMEFINLKVNKYVAEKTSFTEMQLDETLMFDNDNNQRLMAEHLLSINVNMNQKYDAGTSNNFKKTLLIDKLEDYFIKNYNIKFYIGYNSLHSMFLNSYINQESKQCIIYTNTNLYILFTLRVSQSGTYRGAHFYAYATGKSPEIIFNMDTNTANGQNGNEWCFRYSNIYLPISSNTTYKFPTDTINANLIRVIHPHVYADYLYLINPRNTYNILNNSKLTIKNLRIEIDELKQNKIESKKIDEAKNTISNLNNKNSELLNENNKLQKEVVSLTSQVYKTIELNETNKKTIDELTNKNNELETIIIKLKRENDQMSQLLSVN